MSGETIRPGDRVVYVGPDLPIDREGTVLIVFGNTTRYAVVRWDGVTTVTTPELHSRARHRLTDLQSQQERGVF